MPTRPRHHDWFGLAFAYRLDGTGDITEITQDEILQRASETTERRVYSLTVICRRCQR